MPKKPMSEEEYAKARQRILKEAITIVGEGSVAALSMRSLSQRVGLTPGALYRYFPNRQAILCACWDDALEELGKEITAINTRESDPINAIRAMSMVYVKFCLANPDRFRLLFLENEHAISNDQSPLNAGILAYDLLLERVKEAIALGIFSGDNPVLIGQALWASVHGAVTLLVTIIDVELVDHTTLVQTVIDTMICGFQVRAATQ